MGNIALKTAGKHLSIAQITSCDSFAIYMTTKFSMIKFEACDSTFDKLLESIQGGNEDKNYMIKDRLGKMNKSGPNLVHNMI